MGAIETKAKILQCVVHLDTLASAWVQGIGGDTRTMRTTCCLGGKEIWELGLGREGGGGQRTAKGKKRLRMGFRASPLVLWKKSCWQ